MTPRNAASVLPEPVGALISVCLCDPIASQALSWPLVGPKKAPRNQPGTAGWNCSGSMGVGLPKSCVYVQYVAIGRNPAWRQIALPNTTASDVIPQSTVVSASIPRFSSLREDRSGITVVTNGNTN